MRPPILPATLVLLLGATALSAGDFVVTSAANTGPGTLRQAITDANATAGPHRITFNVGAGGAVTLAPTTALPALVQPVTIDGATQPGFAGLPLIELSGNAAPNNTDGLRLTTSNSVLRALCLNRWRRNGVEIVGSSNVVVGCFVGTGLLGTNDLGNSQNGILISSGAGNRIGGTTEAEGNVLSGNDAAGLRLDGTNTLGTVVLGNRLGTDRAGTIDLGNTTHGLYINRAIGSRVGSADAGGRNWMSGNNGNGILIEGANVADVRVVNAWIGTDATGLLSLSNNAAGILINAGTGHVIGSTASGAGCRIAFNGGDGIHVAGGTNHAVRGNRISSNFGLGLDLGSNGVTANDASDTDTGANQLQNFPVLTTAVLRPGSTEVTGELRSRPGQSYDLDLYASDAADPSGNGEGEEYLGSFRVTTDAAGVATFSNSVPVGTLRRFVTMTATDPAGNTSEFSAAHRARTTLPPATFLVTTVSDAGAGSLRQAILDANAALNLGDRIAFQIPGNGPHVLAPPTALPALTAPVLVDGLTQPGAVAGTSGEAFDAVLPIVLDGNSAPAGTDGLSLQVPDITVRGLNLIRWKGDGIEVAATADRAVIEGCRIGLGADGTDLGQGFDGILVNGASGVRIGGTTPDARNLISGNNRHGIQLSGATATGNRILRNLIGTDPTGLLARGNSSDGIHLANAPDNQVGGVEAGAGNRIAGNLNDGLELNGTGATGNRILGNRIGVSVVGTALKNNGQGISIQGGWGNQVGGVAAGEANQLGYNGTAGVLVSSGTNNVIRGNRFVGNGGLGVDLGGVGKLANDVGDADVGANQQQNFPVLAQGRIDVGATQVSGSLASGTNRTYVLDFYSSSAGDSSGNGEGEQYLGSHAVTTDGTGLAAFTITLPVGGQGRFLTATATDADGNTSEFSPWIMASSTVPPSTFTVTTPADSGPGSLRQAMLDADRVVSGFPHLIRFQIPGSGPHVIGPLTQLPTLANESIRIDGFTQPGSRPNTLARADDAQLAIVLDGGIGQPEFGLRFATPGNEVVGLSIVSFQRAGIALGSASNVVEGCRIGMRPDGTIPSSADQGILVRRDAGGGQAGAANRLGGATPAARNVIVGHSFGAGIYLPRGSSNNVILGNFLGVAPSGSNAIQNNVGIRIEASSGNRIGGAAPGEGNVISGNQAAGISLTGGDGNHILGNQVGVAADGVAPLGNGQVGISVGNGFDNRIGGVAAGEGNHVAFNGGTGIQVAGFTPTERNAVRGNSIHDNAGIGFDLGPGGFPNPNDAGDLDGGDNRLQNHPVLTSGNVGLAGTTFAGTLESTPQTTFLIDLYANVAADASGFGEGRQYLGSVSTTTGTNGLATFSATLPGAAIGSFLSATATDPLGNTSEFGRTFEAESQLAGATFTVTTTADAGPGSLRQAILDSNASSGGANRIAFNIPGGGPHRLVVRSNLPPITRPVVVDGFTQPGSTPNSLAVGGNAAWVIHVDNGAGSAITGLQLEARDITIQGLALTGFGSAIFVRSDRAWIAGNLLGMAPDGTVRGNGFGVFLNTGRGVRLGGSAPAHRNVISGNTQVGVLVTAPGSAESPVNEIEGNHIGTNPTGDAPIPNLQGGISLQGTWRAMLRDNLVSGNTGVGVQIVSARDVRLEGNRVGVRADQTAALANGSHGVQVTESSQFVIGGATPGQGNVLGGNGGNGVLLSLSSTRQGVVTHNAIGTDRSGTLRLGNARHGVEVVLAGDIRVGGPGEGNLIAYNAESGVRISAASPVSIRQNRIFGNGRLGIDDGGDGPNVPQVPDTDLIPNAPVLTSATLSAGATSVEGTLTGRPDSAYTVEVFVNTVPDPSGTGEGQEYLGTFDVLTAATGIGSFSGPLPATTRGRYLSATATSAEGHTSEFGPTLRAASTAPPGIFTVVNVLDSGPGSLRQALLDANARIASTAHTIRFAIPGEGDHTIALQAALPMLTEAVDIQGFTQPGSLANAHPVEDRSVRRIRLSSVGPAGSDSGLHLAGPGSRVSGIAVAGFPGAGLLLAAPDMGVEGCELTSNRVAGIHVVAAGPSRIGGASPAARNRVSANGGDGVLVTSPATGLLTLQGNLIGTAADGVTLAGNGGDGVANRSTARLVVGGVTTGAGNVIAGNRSNGVLISDGSGNTIRGNRLFLNQGLGVDLSPFGFGSQVTPNDAGDADSGPNGLQNFPVLSRAAVTLAGFRIQGTFNSRPGRTYTLDFYHSQPERPGEAETWLGSAEVSTDASGNAVLDVVLPIVVSRGSVSATATDAEGSTSEISATVPVVTDVVSRTFTVVTPADSGPGSLRQALLDLSEAFTLERNIIAFNLPGDGIRRIEPESPLPTINRPVVLDGFTQPGTARRTAGVLPDPVLRVQIDGFNAPADASGLTIGASNVVVRGLILTGFGGAQISAANARGLVIEECFIGTDGFTPRRSSSVAPLRAGTRRSASPAGNGADSNGAGAGIVVRESDVTLRDSIVSANSGDGLYSLNSAVTLTDNLFGSDSLGSRALGNAGHGIHLHYSTRTFLPASLVSGNTVVDNAGFGIAVTVDPGLFINGPQITGNQIGALPTLQDGSGFDPMGNGSGGVLVEAANTRVDANTIGGNAGPGIRVEGSDAGGPVIQGNFIGTGPDGWLPLPNGGAGIELRDVRSGLFAGGFDPEQFNVIAYNPLNFRAVDSGPAFVAGNVFGPAGVFGAESRTAPATVPTPTWLTSTLTDGGLFTVSAETEQAEPPFANATLLTRDEAGFQTPVGNQEAAVRAKGRLVLALLAVLLPQTTDLALRRAFANNEFGRMLAILETELGTHLPQTRPRPTVADVRVTLDPPIILGPGTSYSTVVRIQNKGPDVGVVLVRVELPESGNLLLAISDLFGLPIASEDLLDEGVPYELRPGEEREIELITSDSQPASASITVDLVELQEDPFLADNTATTTMPIPFAGVADLQSIPFQAPSLVHVGDPFTLGFGFRTLSAVPGRVRVAADIPRFLDFATPMVEGAVVRRTGNRLEFDFEGLAPGTRTFSLSATAIGNGIGQVHFALGSALVESEPEDNASRFEIRADQPDAVDYGDAPDGYGTLRVSGGASHRVINGIHLGAAIDADPDGAPGPDAIGDDVDIDGDDDDGVIFHSPIVAGLLATIRVTAASDGFLDGWIDYNGNGVFEHRPAAPGVNEYLFDTVPGRPAGGSYPIKAGPNVIRFFVPNLIRSLPVFARFRFSRAGGLGPKGAAPDGEVEDYPVQTFDLAPDFGDAPDDRGLPMYPTLLANNGAVHLASEEKFHLGQRLDFEPAAQPNLFALGDDGHNGLEFPLSAVADDEDGVSFPAKLVPGETATLVVNLTRLHPGPARLDAWMDFNADYDWNDAGEQVLRNYDLLPGDNQVPVVIPAGAIPGFTYARFRLSRNGNLGPGGVASSGEVEDYRILISGEAATCRIDSIGLEGGKVVIRWTGSATLEAGPTIDGPWTTEPPGNPAILDPGIGSRYFRLRCN